MQTGENHSNKNEIMDPASRELTYRLAFPALPIANCYQRGECIPRIPRSAILRPFLFESELTGGAAELKKAATALGNKPFKPESSRIVLTSLNIAAKVINA